MELKSWRAHDRTGNRRSPPAPDFYQCLVGPTDRGREDDDGSEAGKKGKDPPLTTVLSRAEGRGRPRPRDRLWNGQRPTDRGKGRERRNNRQGGGRRKGPLSLTTTTPRRTCFIFFFVTSDRRRRPQRRSGGEKGGFPAGLRRCSSLRPTMWSSP